MAKFPFTEEDLATIRRLWREGSSLTAIASVFGPDCRKGMIAGKVKRMGLPRRDDPTALRKDRWLTEGLGTKAKPKTVGHGGSQTLSPLPSVTNLMPAIKISVPRVPRKPHAPAPVVVKTAAPVLRNQCCWPLNDGSPRWLFCEAPCERNYCEEHRQRAFEARRGPRAEDIAA